MSEFLGAPTQPAMNIEAREQVRPTDSAPIVRIGHDGLHVANARWWLVPWFHQGNLKAWKQTCFNARAETVKTARTWRDSFARRRCLVVADAWYEWMGPREDDEKRKQPWMFTPRDSEPIMFAGLWDRCDTSDHGLVESLRYRRRRTRIVLG